MSEDMRVIVGKGFDTWKKNINIALPFILDSLFSIIFAVLTGIAAILVIGIDVISQLFDKAQPIFKSIETSREPPILETTALFALIKPYLVTFAIAFVIIFIGTTLIKTFFRAGAIGMAKTATEKGTTALEDMISHAKKHFVNLLLADVLIGLILLAGILFLVPSALSHPELFTSQTSPPEGADLFFLGIVIWISYMLLVSIALSIVPYALVIESLYPLDAVKTGFTFFKSHKLDVILLMILTIAVSFAASAILGSIPSIGGFLNTLVALIIIQPLVVIWWTRLYMAKTNKTLYVNELLLHPDEIPEMI